MIDTDYNLSVPYHVPEALVYDYNLREYAANDPFESAHALVNGPVPDVFWTRNLGGHWIVKGAAAITELDRNSRSFSTERMFVPDYQNPEPEVAFVPMQSDLPEHTALRSIINPLFAPARISMLHGKIRETSLELIAKTERDGSCYFIRDYAREFPVIIFLGLTDLPLEDRFILRDIAQRFLDPSESDDRSKPLKDLLDYLRPIVVGRIDNPGNDVLSAILSTGVNEKGLKRDTAVMLAATVLFGGLDTVSAALAYMAHYLAENPRDRRLLRQDPGMISRAVEEILRRYAVPNTGRVAKEDIIFRGVNIKKGDHVAWSASMHNLDERLFPNAMLVNLDRRSGSHSSFGGGIHFCPGASLARVEMRIFVETWLERFPDFYVEPSAECKYQTGHNVTLKDFRLIIGK